MEFRKSERYALRRPADWVRRNLSACPFCRCIPAWETATAFTLGVKRYYFRCSRCRAVFSVLASDMIPVPGPITRVVNSITLLVRVEDTGEREGFKHLTGREFRLVELQDWARGN